MSFGAHIPICTHSECEHSDICPHGMCQMSGCKCLLFQKIDCDILECASSMKYAQLDIYVGAKRPITSTFMSIQELMNLWPSSPNKNVALEVRFPGNISRRVAEEHRWRTTLLSICRVQWARAFVRVCVCVCVCACVCECVWKSIALPATVSVHICVRHVGAACPLGYI